MKVRDVVVLCLLVWTLLSRNCILGQLQGLVELKLLVDELVLMLHLKIVTNHWVPIMIRSVWRTFRSRKSRWTAFVA